jgi:hypothetical protein|tara:strand:+ start:2360 stop:2959 length:600 start_codon:yes stop_codon:yes gene_type:complete
MYYVVYDNFLRADEFGVVKGYLGAGGDFPWKLAPRINNNDQRNNDMYFATNIYHAYSGWSDHLDTKIFETISSKLYIEALFRIKANMYFPSHTGKVVHHAPHIDADFHHQGALFFLTTCDAPTTMADGTPIESIENRLLLFDPVTNHSSSSPTNASFRQTINFNYFGAGIHNSYKDRMVSPIPIISKNAEKLDEFWVKK